MTTKCAGTCEHHSGICQNIEHLEYRIEELKKDMSEHKGYTKAKFDGTSTEMKELRREMIAEMNKKFDELKTLIEGKEKDKNNKMWSIVSPLVVGVILLVGQYFLKLLN